MSPDFPFPLGPPPPGRRGAAEAGPGTAPEFESVSALTARLRQALERGFARVRVEGEVSNCTRSPRGHLYFSLKDAGAVLGCVVWRTAALQGANAAVAARLRDGASVRATGRIALYEPRGQYQLVVEELIDRGEGDLFRRFLLLKEKLQAEGLFDPGRKRPIPPRARRIGVVTSLRGAALRDLLNVVRRRAPGTVVVVEGALVQGEGAPASLVAALRRLAARAGRDRLEVAILCRGGGSFEDLACFNDETLARAVAAFPLPLIAGIGHEVDWTICDFVADLRAPTPSAAAETAVADRRELARRLALVAARLERAARAGLTRRRLVLERLARHRAFADPAYAVNRARQRLDDFGARLREQLRQRLARAARRLDPLAARLERAGERVADRPRHRLATGRARLEALDPRGVLRRGYAMVTRRRGADDLIISSRDDAPAGTRLTIHFGDGALAARSLGQHGAVEGQTELEL